MRVAAIKQPLICTLPNPAVKSPVRFRRLCSIFCDPAGVAVVVVVVEVVGTPVVLPRNRGGVVGIGDPCSNEAYMRR